MNRQKVMLTLLASVVCLILSYSLGQSPRDGGTLNFAFPQQLRSLNPLDTVQGVQAQLMRFIFSRIIEYDVGFEPPPIPALAERFEISEDSRSFTFYLRQGVTWHDGEPFTASDVAFTFTAAVHPDNPTFWGTPLAVIQGVQAFRAGQDDSISGVEILDDYTIRITLEQPSVAFLDTLSYVSIIPEHVLGDVPFADLGNHDFFVRSPIGTGPFKVVEVVAGRHIRLERNEAYFRGSPHIERVNFIFPEAPSLAAGLETGDIDLAVNLPARDYDRFIDHPNVNIIWQPTNVFCNLQVNTERVPRKIRQAIARAIDREALTQALFGDLAKPFYRHLAYDFLQPNPHELDLSYDPEVARQLVNEAIDEGSWDATRRLDIIFGGTEPSEDLLFIVQYLQEVGINAVMRGVGDTAAFNAVLFQTQDYDVAPLCNAFGPDPDTVHIYYQCDFLPAQGGFNLTRFCNERVDEILLDGRLEVDFERRVALYQELQGILDYELPIIPIRLTVAGWVASNRLLNATPQNFGHLVNYAAIQTWWLEE